MSVPAPAEVEIIAEIANAHQGSPEQAIAIARGAIAAGADAVKFQIYSADELLVRAHPRYAHFRGQAFPPDVWRDVLGRLTGGPTRLLADVFGHESLAVAAAAPVDGVKIHSSDLANSPLVAAAATRFQDLYLAVGGSTAREVARAIAIARSANATVRLTLLHGFQAYPTALADSELRRLVRLQEMFGTWARVGYADHVSGDDPYAVILPCMAVGLGARVIEKHVTLNRAARGVDYYSSLDVPAEFGRFVETVRGAPAACGRPMAMSPAEQTYRRTVKKYVVASRDLAAGQVLTEADVVMKRVDGLDVDPIEIEKLLGRCLVQDIAADAPILRAALALDVRALVIARSASTRLPGKAQRDLGGRPALAHLFGRLRQARRVTGVILCTTTLEEDDGLATLASREGVAVYRGPVDDVLGRMVGALGAGCDLALRVTGDDLLVDPEYVDRAVEEHVRRHREYSDVKQLPSGTEVEVFDADLLRELHRVAVDPHGTEYLTTYVVANGDVLRIGTVDVDPPHRRNWRLTLDTPEDAVVVTKLVEDMAAQGREFTYRLDDIVRFFERHPELAHYNQHVRQRTLPAAFDTTLDWVRLVGAAGETVR